MYHACNEKWQITSDGLGRPNQEKIRTLAENETYKYLDILTPSNKCKWKTEFKKNISELENYSRQNFLAETE